MEHQGQGNRKQENQKQGYQEQGHKRRVRYKGAHPKKYNEKYKELQPERYPETVAKVISKGSTPVGMHISIMVREILEFLQIQPGQEGLDATLGCGGHTQKMLKCLQSKGHLHVLDVDTIKMAKTGERLLELGYEPEVLTVRQLNFAHINQVAAEAGSFDFILVDLGVSPMQIDNPERGFSFKRDGPLDLRLDSEKGIPASQRLMTILREELQGMLIENSDEPYAEETAKAIVNEIKRGNEITTTIRLREVVKTALSFIPEADRREAVKKSCQRTFQALRIDINSEFEVLYRSLGKLPDVLAPRGRVAILTFHFGEDRIVKKSFKQLHEAGVYSEIVSDVVRPSAEECGINSRVRSTEMRWVVKAQKVPVICRARLSLVQ